MNFSIKKYTGIRIPFLAIMIGFSMILASKPVVGQVIIIIVDIHTSNSSESISNGANLTLPPILNSGREYKSNNICTIYPNPVKDKLVINFEEETQVYNLSLIDNEGNIVYDVILSDSETNLIMYGVGSGNYSMRLETDKGTIIKHIIIVD